jgi:hypothetical protein
MKYNEIRLCGGDAKKRSSQGSAECRRANCEPRQKGLGEIVGCLDINLIPIKHQEQRNKKRASATVVDVRVN